ncbi:response regulator [Paenibacillus sp. J5C_2022]|uniref:response regulator n=1 Tax=Paenibacillus sp. J5C2022 TaxID=2977129 RepID=UPI0021D39377|nr:response regulator [Paenibacillus sp. J5C2022]MCU6712300.1 response regulator [Paenibacillus sp. J5C2022]
MREGTVIYTLMIVDDERRILRGLTQAVLESGLPFASIQGFHNAEEALRAMESSPCDILLSDIRMPGRDGLELAGAVRACRPSCKVIFLTGFGQFEYAQQAVKLGAFDFLVKPVRDEQLLQCLERALLSLKEEKKEAESIHKLRSRYEETVPVVRESFLRQCAGSERTDRNVNEIIAEGMFLQLDIALDSPVRFAVMRVNNRKKWIDAPKSGTLDSLLFEAAGTVKGETGLFMECWRDADYFACAWQSKSAMRSAVMEKQLRRALIDMQEKLFERHGMDTSIMLSKQADNLEQWVICYQEALQALKQHISQGRGSIEEVLQGAGVLMGRLPGMDLLESLGLLLEAGDEEQYYNRLNEVFRDARTTPGLPYRIYAEIVHMLSLALLTSVNKLTLTSEERDRLRIEEWTDMSCFYSVEQMSEVFHTVSAEVFKLTSRQRDMNKDVMSRLKWYISQHLSGDLSLSELSKIAHMSTAYLSRIFKETTGEGINHYVTRARIEKAMELLRLPSAKVSDVAVQVGYDNTPYFTKVFKKVVGQTPQEFKND